MPARLAITPGINTYLPPTITTEAIVTTITTITDAMLM